MDAVSAITLIILCIILGVSGQLVRVVIGLKDKNDAFTNKGQENINSEEKTFIDEINKNVALGDESVMKLESKLYDSLDTKWNFELGPIKNSILISLVVGTAIGLLACFYEWSQGTITVDAKFMGLIMATGYAGSDALEGLSDAIKLVLEKIIRYINHVIMLLTGHNKKSRE